MTDVGPIGVGYEGVSLEGLIDRLRSLRIHALIDIRLNAISRKRGFSKTALQTASEAAGIEYVHLPELGNPRDNRPGYAELDTAFGRHARETFQASLTTAQARGALRRIADLSSERNAAVFCYEADEHHCHRQQVIETVRKMLAVPV